MKRERDTRSETREELFRYICENPGASFPSIRNVFRMNDGTLRYHLDYLCGEDKIRRTRDGQRRYYACDVAPAGPARIDGLTREERRVALMIKDRPGISRSELRSMSGAGREDLSYILRKLKERRFIWKVEDGGDPCYEYITERKLAIEMMSLILEKFLDDKMDRETFLALKKRIEQEIA